MAVRYFAHNGSKEKRYFANNGSGENWGRGSITTMITDQSIIKHDPKKIKMKLFNQLCEGTKNFIENCSRDLLQLQMKPIGSLHEEY